MIKSKDFKGGTEVVRRINEEVKRLRIKKIRLWNFSQLIFCGT